MKKNSKYYDSPPTLISGSILVGITSAVFLFAVVLAGFALPTDSAPEKVIHPSRVLEKGGNVFRGEGCSACHSRLVRPGDKGMGPAMGQGEYFSVGLAPGSSRVGPDLQNIAGELPYSLMLTRLEEPRALQPDTLMPSFSHISDRNKTALIKYLEQPLSGPGKWETVRLKNGIETVVPDSILSSLRRYINPESLEIRLPMESTPEYLIAGRGVYGSRCSACHGISGRGDGPASKAGMRAVSTRTRESGVVRFPTDFNSGYFRNYSPVMIYWRVKEGVPGTEMPAWSGALSEDAIWLTVSYVMALADASKPGNGINPETDQDPGTETNTDENVPPDHASEEEGTTDPEAEAPDAVDEQSEESGLNSIGEESP